MALPAALPLLAKILQALLAGQTVNWLSGSLGGPTLEGMLGMDPDAALAEYQKRQAAETSRAQRSFQLDAMTEDFTSGLLPNSNEVATLGSVSGLFDDDLRSPQENLAAYVARTLGTTPADLAARTRPTTPFAQLRG